MTEHLRSYRLLESRLWYTRWRHEGGESPEEDAILDAMDEAWRKLGAEEQRLLRAEGPRCWPLDSSAWPSLPLDQGLLPRRSWSYDDFHSPQETILGADVA